MKKTLRPNYNKILKKFFPNDLSDYLSKKELKLLKLYISGYNISEIVKITKIAHLELILNFIDIGQSLALYKIDTYFINPKKFQPDYLCGWYDYQKAIKGVIKNAIKKEI